MTARFSRAAQQSVEFARKARGHRPRLQLTEYRLNSAEPLGLVRPPSVRIRIEHWELNIGQIRSGIPFSGGDCLRLLPVVLNLGGEFKYCARHALEHVRREFRVDRQGQRFAGSSLAGWKIPGFVSEAGETGLQV